MPGFLNTTNCGKNCPPSSKEDYVLLLIFISCICSPILFCLLYCIVHELLDIIKPRLKSCKKYIQFFYRKIENNVHKTDIQINNLSDNYNFGVKNCLVIESGSKLIKKIGNAECAICIENLMDLLEKEPTSLLKINKCGHIFHIDCIYPWFNEKYKHGGVIDCPLCRQKIYTISY